MKMDIKNMVRDFASLGEAKKRSSVYVKAVSLLCAAIVALVLFFMNMTVRGVTDRILVVNTGGEFLQLKSMETDKLYETLLKAHCNAVAYYVNSFDRMSISGNQAQAVFLVEKSELNAIWNKYLNAPMPTRRTGVSSTSACLRSCTGSGYVMTVTTCCSPPSCPSMMPAESNV